VQQFLDAQVTKNIKKMSIIVYEIDYEYFL